MLAIAVFCAGYSQGMPAGPQAEVSSENGPASIPSGQKFIMQLETPLHTRTTREGERIEFTTAAEVVVDNQVLIPNKCRIRGTVTKSKRAGLLFGRAEMRLRFDEVKLPDGTALPFKASITRMGFDPVDPKTGQDPELKGEAGAGGDIKSVASGSAQGAIIGVLTGGTKGAMYGAAAGAAVAAAGMLFRRGPDLDLPRSTMFEAQFDQPLEIPEASVRAQNTPRAAQTESARAEAARPEENGMPGRPVLKDPRSDQPPEDTAASIPPETSPEEPEMPSRPVLRDPRRERPPEETAASIPPESPAETSADAGSSASTPADPVPGGGPSGGGLTLSVKVRMVQVDAVVRDKAGRMMDRLAVEDFRVYEDGVLQEVQSFSRDELPLAVALVVDRSGSVAPYISELRRVATRALDQLKPQDEVCLFSFADNVSRLEDLTTDRAAIADAIDRIRAGGGTDITDALHEAVNYLAGSAPGKRHAVILVSDNQQTVAPSASEAEVIKTAMETETVVYSLKTSGDPLQLGAQLPSLIFGGDTVNKITRETGGEIINVGRVSSVSSALASVISRLRMRYSFGYYPTGTGQGGMFHSITVRLTDSHGKAGSDYFIHAKRGYYATGSSGGTSTARNP